MFKRIIALVCAAVCVGLIGAANKTPLFKNYADGFELYLGESSSTSSIVYVSEREYAFFDGICGESFKTDSEGFDLNRFLTDFAAQVVHTESIDGVTSYYAYSPKIKYRAQVFGQTVNLHVVISSQVTVGAPLIFGSF